MSDRSAKKREIFIARSREIHGDKYDYSRVIYKTCKDKVEIICPIHGSFMQTPDHHINDKNGCPKCRYDRIKATVRERYGVDYVSQSAGFQARVEQTNLRKYGVRRPMQSLEIQSKARETSRNNWGADYPMQCSEIVDRFQQSFLEKYGVVSPFQDAIIMERMRSTMLDRYGVDNAMQVPEIHARSVATKREHGTINSSAPEDYMCELLRKYFGVNNVERQYWSKAYPFNVDAYIKSLSLYIELNASWIHGGHYFDSNCDDDLVKLAFWQQKAETSSYYRSAVETWTIRDLLKRETAIRNGLNYLVFWDNDLHDFLEWFGSLK